MAIEKINVNAIIRKIDKHKAAIGAERDRLDDFIGELEDLRDSCIRAWDELQNARDALSELV